MEIFTGHKIGDWFPIKKLIPPEFLSIYIIESKKKKTLQTCIVNT